MDSIRKPFTFDRVVRIGITIAVIGIILWLINYLKGVLLPFAIACLIAYMINPLVEWNKKILRFKGRTWATIISLVELVLALSLVLWLLIPYIYTEAHDMTIMLSDYMKSQLNVPYLPAAVHDFIRDNIDLDYIRKLLSRDEWIDLIKKTAEQTWSMVDSTLSVIIALFSSMMVVLYVIFILIDYDKITAGFKKAIPQRYRPLTLRIFHDMKTSMHHYFRGQALVALCVGILYSLGFYIIDLPMGIGLGIFVGVLNMVPYLQLISFPIAAMLCLVNAVSTGESFWELAMWTTVVYCVVQVIQDMFLTPKIMGKSMGLNPAIILLSLSVWGALLGFVGLIVALPLTTLVIAYYNEYVIGRYEPPTDSANKADSDEQPPQKTENDNDEQK